MSQIKMVGRWTIITFLFSIIFKPAQIKGLYYVIARTLTPGKSIGGVFTELKINPWDTILEFDAVLYRWAEVRPAGFEADLVMKLTESATLGTRKHAIRAPTYHFILSANITSTKLKWNEFFHNFICWTKISDTIVQERNHTFYDLCYHYLFRDTTSALIQWGK